MKSWNPGHYNRKLKNSIPVGVRKTLTDTARFFRELPFLVEDVKKAYSLKEEFTFSRKAEKRIWYFSVPIHPNLGDQAQYVCIREWLEFIFPDAAVLLIPSRVFLRMPSRFLRWIRKVIQPDDPIVFQSGYTMTDFHPDERVRRIVLKRYFLNPVLIFPQTILYQGRRAEKQAAKTLRKCPRLLLLARDKISLKEAAILCPGHGAYWPDMTVKWLGRYSFQGEHKGILFCIRQDGESILSPERRKNIFHILEKFGPVEACGTESAFPGIARKEEIENLIRRFSHAKLVVTDRYHGMLFALAAGVPVITLPVSGHKVFSGAQEFAALCPGYVRTAANENDLRLQVKALLDAERPPLPEMNSFFQDLARLTRPLFRKNPI